MIAEADIDKDSSVDFKEFQVQSILAKFHKDKNVDINFNKVVRSIV